MRSVVVERTLNVPKSAVWEKVSDIGNVYIFNPMVERSALVGDQACGVGARRTCALGKGSGMKGHLEEEVIGWEEGESVTIRINSGPMPTKFMSIRFDLHEVAANRTGIRATVQYVMKGGLLGNLMGGIMMGPMLTSMMNKLFRGLEKHLLTGEMITA
jgi:carbon monoxide dehydrogenase subunit G